MKFWTKISDLDNFIKIRQWVIFIIVLNNACTLLLFAVMIFVRYLSEIRYFESRKPIIPTGFRYCVTLHFRHFRFRFLSGWSYFKDLVRNLNRRCAWRHSYHSIKRIINTGFSVPTRTWPGTALRRAAQTWSVRKRKPTYKTCRHQYYTVQPYMDPASFRIFAWLKLEPCHLSR